MAKEQQMMYSALLVLLPLLSLLTASMARPKGAPESACESMIPSSRPHNEDGHKGGHGAKPQGSDFPYKFTTDNSKEGKVLVMLEGKNGKKFKGFFLQVMEIFYELLKALITV